MPRETATPSALATPVEHLQDLMDRLKRSGWKIEDRDKYWGLIGGKSGGATLVQKHPSFQSLKALEHVLAAEGWTPEHAEVAPQVRTIDPLEEAPSEESRNKLNLLIELVRRTPGWRCISENGGWRITGGINVVTVPSAHLSLHDVDGIESALVAEGWDRAAAEELIARVDAHYEEFRTQVPEGGYPKQDRIITRAEAVYMLNYTDTCGCNFRAPRQRKVDQYAEAMKRGEWRPFSPQGLVMSEEHNCLLDGRQRLMGLVQSGLAGMGFSVTSEVPMAEFPYLDQGATRTIGDLLVPKGIPKSAATTVGAAVKLAIGYDSGLPWKRWHTLNLTGGQICAALEEDGAYVGMLGAPYKDALTLGWNKHRNEGCKMAPAVGTALSFLIRRDYPEIPWEDIDEGMRPAYEYAGKHPWEQFRTALVYGTNLTHGDPRHSFRNYMTARDQKTRRRYEMYLQLGGALLTWELWLNGVPGTVQFKDNQEMPRVWRPGLGLSGKDAARAVQRRQARAARAAQAAENCSTLFEDN